MSSHNTNVLIVGAGLTGLSTAHVLRQNGIPVTILEGAEQVAWNWQERHPALRLNIHRKFAALPGKPAPITDGAFLTRDTLVAHLATFADDFADRTVFGAHVSKIEKSPEGWRLLSGERAFEAPHVVFATGRDRTPFIPDWQGLYRFQGEVIHVANLGDVSRYDGKRVLVVGAGNSGGDCLNHLAQHNPKAVSVSVRNGPAIVPKRLFGFPLHRAANLFAAMPLKVVDPAFSFTQRICFGDLRKHGIHSHPVGGGTRLAIEGTAFTIDDGFVRAIQNGRFKVFGDVREFTEDSVIFCSGHSIRPDVVICATGYRTGLESLLGDLDVLDRRGRPVSPAGEPVATQPGLWFNGYKPAFQGYFYAAAKGAERIARSIRPVRRRSLFSAIAMQRYAI